MDLGSQPHNSLATDDVGKLVAELSTCQSTATTQKTQYSTL